MKMSRTIPSDDDHTDALPFPSNRPPPAINYLSMSASSVAHTGERPPIEEQLRLVTSTDVTAATSAAAELGALLTKEERQRQQKPPSTTQNSNGASYGVDAPAAPPRTVLGICADAGCNTVLVVEGGCVAEAIGAYARTTKTVNGQPVYAMAGKWNGIEVHYVVYKEFRVGSWTIGIHRERTLAEFEQCVAYYRGRIVSIIICVCRCSISSSAPTTDRSKDGGKRWSVAKRFGPKPEPVVTTRESSVGPSPAVAAIRRGTSADSDKSEEGPCLFEPSPGVAVTSAREWGKAKSAASTTAASTKTHSVAKSAGGSTSTKFAAVTVPPKREAIQN